jgi:RHS repeat-associated protein/uncharacterized repeat protein (TIGR01451 family)
MGSLPFRLLSSRAITVASLLVLVAGVLPSGVARAGNGNGNANLHLDKTVASVAVSPQITLTLAVNKPNAIPGDVLTYTGVVANTGATLTLTGTLVASNTNATTATVASYWDAISTNNKAHCGAGGTNSGKDTSQWPAFVGTAAAQPGYTPVSAAPIASGMTLAATPVSADGVTYPVASATDQILGTVLAPGATATWQYSASIPLTTAQLAFLRDPAQVTRIRNSFHAEPTPRVQQGNGQPDQIDVDFCSAFDAADTSGAASNVTVTITLPDGTTKTIDKSTVPSLASIALGSSATATTTYAVPVPAAKGASETDAAYMTRLASLDGQTLSAEATAKAGSAGSSAGPAGPVLTTEHLPIASVAKTGPATIDAGKSATYSLALANAGSAPAASLTLTDSLPGGTVIPTTGTPASLAPGDKATASATYTVPVGQPAGNLTDTASLRWTDANGNSYGPVSSQATTSVTQAHRLTTLTLSPPQSGPLPVGATLTLTVKALDQGGAPMANLPIVLSVVGPNATSHNLTTGADGTVTFTYTGVHAGTDTVQASGTGADSSLSSNTATAIWITPVQTVSTTTIHGRFFTNNYYGDPFLATPASTPVFEQDFPTINFDPVAGTVANNASGVNEWTRPFTDITTDLAGNYTGTIVAAGNGQQAGSGNLGSFDAVFTGSYTIGSAGDYTFDVLSDDGFIFGVGDGATALPGNVMYNAPASGLTAFNSYPIMGAFNHNTGPQPYSISVHFPAPGVYHYEVDYDETWGASLCLTVRLHSTGEGVTPTGTLALSPTLTTAGGINTPKTYTVSVMDAAGAPIVNLPVKLDISGANTGQVPATTDARGLASFTYVGSNTGADQLQAYAILDGMPALSNTVAQSWVQGGAVAPPIIGSVSPVDGAEITAPTPITASFTPPAGQTISSWQVVYSRQGTAGTPVILASGTGTPPATLATFDPTVLANGGYTITVAAYGSGGVGLSTSVDVTVDGNLKLGRYQVTYQDANVPVGGIPIQVQRTYDSFDKSTGAFGVGWQLGVVNFRVYTDGPLGAGGWSQYATSCFLAGLGGGLCQMSWATARPHFVSVVWPDGHTETFDFTPSGGSNLFWIGSAAFTARAGSTSKLAVAGDASLSYKGDGNLYGSIGGSTVFDPTRFTLTARDGTVYVLDTGSGLVSETDRNGNTVTVDSAGIHSSLGPSLTFKRDSQNRISELDKPDGSKVTYAYDSAGNLASVTDERGNTGTYQYDANHNLTKTLDPSGHPLRTLKFDSDGRLISVTDGAGNTSTINVDPNAKTETVTGPDPRLTTISSMDAKGDIVQIDEVFSGKTLTTKFTYDDLGHVLSTTDPLGNVTRATYDAAGSPLTLTEPDGGTWTFTYNSCEQLTSITDPSGHQVDILSYDTYGDLIKKTIPGGMTTYTYGSTGLLISDIDPRGRTTSYGYDAAGHVTRVTGPDGRTTVYAHDAEGRTTSVTDPAGATTTFAYDAAGNLTSYVDALGHGQTYAYDALGRAITVGDALGHATTYTYDGGGRITSTVDRNGKTTGFSYDQSGNLTAVTLPDGSSLSCTYDPLGRLTDANDASETLHFVYNDAGDLVSQTSAGTATSIQPIVTLSFGVDGTGRPTSLTAPWGTIGFAYNGDGLLDTVTDPSGGVFNLGYDPLGQLTSMSRPNGVTDAYAYDAVEELLSRTSSRGSAAIDALSYTYDSSGRTTSKTNSSGTTSYAYDTADRLISVLAPSGSNVPSETFTYDAVGNQTGNGQTYDADNRLLSDATYNYTYDGEGNLTSKTVRASGAKTTYAWNALHQLTSATLPDGAVVSYRYDALGRRVEQSSSSGTTRYVNLGANVVAEYDGTNTLRASYVTTLGTGDLPGVPLEANTSGHATYPLLDAAGSVTAITDASGAVSSTFSYTAYGQPVGASSGTYSYGTYGYDNLTGLYYSRARYYDPASGRFLGEDPVPGVQPYSYASDCPSVLADPTGEDPLVETSEIRSLIAGPEEVASDVEGTNTVYVAIEQDNQFYFGISDDYEARMVAHGQRFRASEQVTMDLTRGEARITETRLMQSFGDATHWAEKAGTPTLVTNIIRSVGQASPLFGYVDSLSTTLVDVGAVVGAVTEWLQANGAALTPK